MANMKVLVETYSLQPNPEFWLTDEEEAEVNLHLRKPQQVTQDQPDVFRLLGFRGVRIFAQVQPDGWRWWHVGFNSDLEKACKRIAQARGVVMSGNPNG